MRKFAGTVTVVQIKYCLENILHHWFESDLSVSMSLWIATGCKLFSYYNCYVLVDSADKVDGASAHENSSVTLNTYVTSSHIPKMEQE